MAGSGWQVTDEALAAMEAASAGLEETTEQLRMDIEALESVFEDNEAGLGAHSEEIRNLLDELKKIGEAANNPVKRLVLKLVRSTVIRRAHMEENKYSQGRSR